MFHQYGPLYEKYNSSIKFNELGHFSTDISYTTTASSPPYCITRNIETYVPGDCNVKKDNSFFYKFNTTAILEEDSYRQLRESMYCNNRLIDQKIPVTLLNNVLKDSYYREGFDTFHKPRRMTNSLLSFNHGDRRVILHSAGAHLDQLVLRYADHCQPHSKQLEPGFSIQLGNGSPLCDIQIAGTSEWNCHSNILARNKFELFQLKSESVDSNINNNSSTYDDYNNNVTLHPLQKWSLPKEIQSMSSSNNSLSYSSLLTTDGLLYTWTAQQGLTLFSKESIFDINDQSNNKCLTNSQVEVSNHPKIVYLSDDHKLFLKDLRTRTKAMFHLFAQGVIQSLKSYYHYGQDHYLFCACDNENPHAAIIDLRYTKTTVQQRFIPEAHESLQINYYNQFHDNCSNDFTGIVISGSSWKSRRIYTHLIDIRDMISTSSNIPSDIVNLEYTAKLFSSAHPAGIKRNCINWNVSGYPVVDRNSVAGLNGFALVPYHEGLQDKSIDKELNTYNCLLIQQSSCGDIYSQRLWIRYGNDHEIKCHSNHNKNFNKETDSANSYETKSLELTIGQPFQAVYPPIQLNLPMGNRCEALVSIEYKSKLQSNDLKIKDFTLEKSLTKYDYDINTYPTTRTNYVPFLGEDSMTGFSINLVDIDEIKTYYNESTSKTNEYQSKEDMYDQHILRSLPRSYISSEVEINPNESIRTEVYRVLNDIIDVIYHKILINKPDIVVHKKTDNTSSSISKQKSNISKATQPIDYHTLLTSFENYYYNNSDKQRNNLQYKYKKNLNKRKISVRKVEKVKCLVETKYSLKNSSLANNNPISGYFNIKMEEILTNKLIKSPLTLHEIWKYMNEYNEKHDITIKMIANYLRGHNDVQEYHIDLLTDCINRHNIKTLDNIYVSSSSPIDNDITNLCDCERNYLDDNNIIRKYFHSNNLQPISDIDIYPCGSKLCPVLHGIVFRYIIQNERDFNPKVRSLNVKPDKFRWDYKDCLNYVTDDVIDKLNESWNNTRNEDINVVWPSNL